MSTTTQIVITGIAPVSRTGARRATDCWEALVDGVSGLAPDHPLRHDGFPVKLAGEVLDIEPATGGSTAGSSSPRTAGPSSASSPPQPGPRRRRRRPRRASTPTASRSITAAGSGGNEFGQREIQSLWSRGPRAVTVYQSIAWFYAATTGQISIRHGSKGHVRRARRRRRGRARRLRPGRARARRREPTSRSSAAPRPPSARTP